MIFTPFIVNKTCTLQTLGITFCSTSSGVNTNIRIGLYNDNNNMFPSTLIQDLGYASTTSSSLQYMEIQPSSNITFINKNIYWICVSGDGASKLQTPEFINSLYNPLLGIIPFTTGSSTSDSNALIIPSSRNISNYFSSSTNSNTSLPLTASQVSSSYGIYSYDRETSFILPLVKILY
jgi:hypothetical protein